MRKLLICLLVLTVSINTFAEEEEEFEEEVEEYENPTCTPVGISGTLMDFTNNLGEVAKNANTPTNCSERVADAISGMETLQKALFPFCNGLDRGQMHKGCYETSAKSAAMAQLNTLRSRPQKIKDLCHAVKDSYGLEMDISGLNKCFTKAVAELDASALERTLIKRCDDTREGKKERVNCYLTAFEGQAATPVPSDVCQPKIKEILRNLTFLQIAGSSANCSSDGISLQPHCVKIATEKTYTAVKNTGRSRAQKIIDVCDGVKDVLHGVRDSTALSSCFREMVIHLGKSDPESKAVEDCNSKHVGRPEEVKCYLEAFNKL